MSPLTRHPERSPSLHTEELGGVRLLLRDDLIFTLQHFGGETCYVIEDPVHSAYYRIGCAEYTFLSLLNGRNTVSQAIARAAALLGPNALTEQEAAVICRWLTDHHLAGTSQSAHSQRFAELQRKSRLSRWKALLNPLMFSISLGNPSPLLHGLLPWLGWLYRPVGICFWMAVLSLAVLRLLVNWRGIVSDSVPVLAPENWVWLALVWTGLKVVHEISHGLCCLIYGGTVRVFGINTVLFVPRPFVDTSSAWRLPSKWRRMHVAFAGIYAELLLAALAVFVRSSTDSDLLNMLCLHVILTGGLLTLLFNLNPLVRFDGYYLLTDWVELPNLAQVSRQLVMQIVKRALFGVRFPASDYSRRLWLLLVTYGTLAAVWKVMITASLIFAAEKLFLGAGLPLAVLATVLWIVVPLVRALRYLAVPDLQERPSRLRFAAILSVTAGLLFLFGRSVLWPEELQLPAVVDFVPAETVRSTVPGFVTHVLVQPGQFVREGDALLQLSNPDVDFEIAELEVEVQRSQLRKQFFQSHHDMASRQTEDVHLASMQQKLVEKTQSRSELTIRSPTAGVVIADDLTNLPGQFLAPGQPVCIIGNTAQKNVRVVISQDQVEPVLERTGTSVDVIFRGAASEHVRGTLSDIEPRASTQLVHPALAAIAGGPLAVQAAQVTENSAGTAWVLTEPCFTGTVAIPDEVRERCGAGQLATVHVRVSRQTVTQRLVSAVNSWVEAKRRQ